MLAFKGKKCLFYCHIQLSKSRTRNVLNIKVWHFDTQDKIPTFVILASISLISFKTKYQRCIWGGKTLFLLYFGLWCHAHYGMQKVKSTIQCSIWSLSKIFIWRTKSLESEGSYIMLAEWRARLNFSKRKGNLIIIMHK